MSSASDFTPWPRPRYYGQTFPKGRPVTVLKWDKLFAEATEKDTKEDKDFEITGDADSEDYEDSESEYEKDIENEVNEEHKTSCEMPLNLCSKAKTVPNMNTQFETTENSSDLSAEKSSAGIPSKSYEKVKQISCTLPNFQSGDCQDMLSEKKNYFDENNCVSKEIFYKREDDIENSQSNKNINNVLASSCTQYNNRSPLLDVNNLESNTIMETKKSSLGNQELYTPMKNQLSSLSSNNCVSIESKKIEENKGVEKEPDKQNPVTKPNKFCKNDKKSLIKQKLVEGSQPQDQVRFAMPAIPERVSNSGKSIIINGKSYQVLAPLGKGGSSYVYLVLNSENELLAVKCVKLADVSENIKNNYLNEIQHLMRMQHSRHVIRLFDHQYVASRKLLYAVMEKGDTDLSRFLKDKAASEEGITPELILYYWNEMLLAVKCIHDNNIIHRDLKPANFLLVSGRLKLIDFGIASSIQNEQTSILMDTQSGTFNYMSPEALLDLGSGNEIVLKIGRKSDVWSLGCILYYFLYKKTPYQDLIKPLQKMKAITDPNYAIKFPKLPGVPDILIQSCKRCLVHDRKKRASIEELLDLKNRPLLTLSQVLTRLKSTLSENEYAKAEKAFSEEISEEY